MLTINESYIFHTNLPSSSSGNFMSFAGKLTNENEHFFELVPIDASVKIYVRKEAVFLIEPYVEKEKKTGGDNIIKFPG